MEMTCATKTRLKAVWIPWHAITMLMPQTRVNAITVLVLAKARGPMASCWRFMPSTMKGSLRDDNVPMYVTTPNDNDIISAVYGDDETPLSIATTTSFYQHPFGSSLGSNNNPLLYTGFPELEFDSWLTMGLDGPAGDNEVAPSTIGDLNNGWISNFEAGMNVLIEDSIGGAMFVTNDRHDQHCVWCGMDSHRSIHHGRCDVWW